MQQHTTYDACLALAAVSFIAVVSALSVNMYEWRIITGIAILSVDIPLLVGFGRWIPPDLGPHSKWHDHVAHNTFLLCMPLAVIGISFILAHVHAICGVLFTASSLLASFLYKRRLDAVQRDQPPKI
jgi:hypothetical protein